MAEEPKRQRYQSTSEMALSQMGSTIPGPLPSDHRGSAGQIIRGVVGGDQAAAIQRGIDDCMRSLVADMRRAGDGGNPWTAGERPGTVRPASAAPVRTGPVVRGTGWREAQPLDVPGGATSQAYIEAMTQAMQPHGVGNKEHRGKKGEE
jgi:hypothetical protein